MSGIEASVRVGPREKADQLIIDRLATSPHIRISITQPITEDFDVFPSSSVVIVFSSHLFSEVGSSGRGMPHHMISCRIEPDLVRRFQIHYDSDPVHPHTLMPRDEVILIVVLRLSCGCVWGCCRPTRLQH